MLLGWQCVQLKIHYFLVLFLNLHENSSGQVYVGIHFIGEKLLKEAAQLAVIHPCFAFAFAFAFSFSML